MSDELTIGSGKRQALTCCLCGQPITGYGHNPDTDPNRWQKPLGAERCCERCNHERVLPARMGLGYQGLGTYEAKLVTEIMSQLATPAPYNDLEDPERGVGHPRAQNPGAQPGARPPEGEGGKI